MSFCLQGRDETRSVSLCSKELGRVMVGEASGALGASMGSGCQPAPLGFLGSSPLCWAPPGLLGKLMLPYLLQESLCASCLRSDALQVARWLPPGSVFQPFAQK